MMFRLTFPLTLVAALFTSPAQAVWFNSLIYDIPSDKTFISRPIVNDTDRTNLYTLSAYKIDKPGKGGERRIDGGAQEILWSPLKFTIAPDGSEYFKLYYRGPQDDQERYYRVVFKEAPVRLFPLAETRRNLNIIPVTAMSTILIVRPRQSRFAWHVDEKTGVIENTGNTYFRVIIHNGCNGDDESSTQFYMLPGDKYQDSNVSAGNRKFIVAMERYHPLGSGCFSPQP
ncbi:hypothetical protein [Entomohabitans teleogrylli]|uniref:hypothetical protein n=1 Tax=Entomohabitans teleogrylli TaxID=1384589 RepID=UPI00073D3B87|nr:hypothetical protein [Entomohabitans teleogrylli]